MRETVSYSTQQPPTYTPYEVTQSQHLLYLYILPIYLVFIYLFILIVNVDDVIIINTFKNPYKMLKLIDDYRNYKSDIDS